VKPEPQRQFAFKTPQLKLAEPSLTIHTLCLHNDFPCRLKRALACSMLGIVASTLLIIRSDPGNCAIKR